MAPRYTEPADRIARVTGATDAHGNPVVSYADPVPIPGGVSFDPGSSSEPRMSGHDRVTVEPTIYGTFDMDVLPGDRVAVRGTVFEVVGEVRRWRSPYSGRTPGSVLTLKVVTG